MFYKYNLSESDNRINKCLLAHEILTITTKFLNFKSILGPMGSANIPPPTPAQNSRHHHRTRRASTDDDSGNGQKRPRLVFSDIQKRTLQVRLLDC